MYHRRQMTPRTLYNGPFVLSKHSSNSVCDINKGCEVNCDPNHIPLQHILSSVYSQPPFNTQTVFMSLEAEQLLQEPRTSSISRMVGLSPVSDTCLSVYNFSFLDESSTSYHAVQNSSSPSGLSHALTTDLKDDISAATNFPLSNKKNMSNKSSNKYLCTPQDQNQTVESTKNIESDKEVHFIKERSQDGPSHWRKATHGFVCENPSGVDRKSYSLKSHLCSTSAPPLQHGYEDTTQPALSVGCHKDTPRLAAPVRNVYQYNRHQDLPERRSQGISTMPTSLWPSKPYLNFKSLQKDLGNQQASPKSGMLSDYSRERQRQQHHPPEVLASSYLKCHQDPRALARFPLRKNFSPLGSHICPPFTDFFQGSQALYPYHAPQYPIRDESALPFVHTPPLFYDTFYDYPSPQFTSWHRDSPAHPCRPHGGYSGNAFNDSHPLADQYPGWKAGFDRNASRDSGPNQIYTKSAGGQRQKQLFRSRTGDDPSGRWQYRNWGQSRDKDLYRCRYSEQQKLATCSGAGLGRGKHQPVNAVSQEKASGSMKPAGLTNMAETLRLLIKKLKEFPAKENSIQTIENCVTASGLPIKTFFVLDESVMQIHSRSHFSGALYINDLFIAHSTCHGKKMLKHKVYDAALQFLKTKSVEDLLAQDDLRQKQEFLSSEPAFVKDEVGTKINCLKEKLVKLQEAITNSKHPQHLPVRVFDMAFKESQCELRRRYEVEPVRTERGIHVYTRTRVLIEGKTVAFALAASKKESKIRACQKVIVLFTSSDIDTILKEYFEGEQRQEIPPEIQEMAKERIDKQHFSQLPSIIMKHEQEECLDRLIHDLKLPAKDGVSTVMIIDKHCIQLKMKLLAIYKSVRSPGQLVFITCGLYILDCFIAQGKGTTRKMAQSDAYLKGSEVLKKSRGSDVLTAFPKFSEEDLSKPDIIDIVYKGYTKMHESNRCRLNRLKQLPEEKRKISELVIIEHEDWAEDRKKHSHCILNQSATQCGCLLEWTTEPENSCFRCTMKLQGEKISSVVARQRKTALSMASSVALFNLYETQPVIQGFHLDYPKVWISRDELLKQADSHLEDYPSALSAQAYGIHEVDRKISRAMDEMLDTFFSCPTLEDFVAAPDWQPEEKKLVRILAIARGLKVATDIYCEERLPIISRKYDLSEMVTILESQTNKTQGRYSLLPQEEKPSYNDIAGEVAANESIVKHYQMLTGVSNQGRMSLEADVEEETDSEHCVDNDDVSLNSENSDAYVTADSTFNDVTAVKDRQDTGRTTSPQMFSEVPLPTSTSTPVKISANNNTSIDTLETTKAGLSTWSTANKNTCDIDNVLLETLGSINIECLEINSNPVATTLAGSLKVVSGKEFTALSALPLPSVIQDLGPLDTAPVQLCAHTQRDLCSFSWSKAISHPQAQRPCLPQPQPQLKHQKRLNLSIDVEAGMDGSGQRTTNQWNQKGWCVPDQQLMEEQQQQWLKHRQQKQWVEQEHQ